MRLYNIRYYQPEDRSRLIQFLDKFWRKNHIVATSDIVFDFQYKNDDRYTFVVAENKETHEIDGVYGYILTRKYDLTHQVPNVAWGAIWKVRDDVKNQEIGKVGLALLRFIISNEVIDTFAVSGISEVNKTISAGLGFYVGEMSHYYIANSKLREYSIARNPIIKEYEQSGVKLTWVEWGADIEITNTLNPYKNYNYFTHRYKNHPIYEYRLLGAYIDKKLQLLIVVRKQRVNNGCCLRIVDMIGNALNMKNIGSNVQSILEHEKAEYIDCWNYGLSCDFFKAMGFSKVKRDTIIPDYFAPFERRNIKIGIEIMDADYPLIIFKGDGDQDRPNSEIRENW